MSLDKRVHAYRSDLADIALRDQIKAENYAEGAMRQCLQGVVPLLDSPRADARQISQIRYGEFIDVFEFREDGFLWVQNRSDRYVGYMPETPLGESIAMLSNRVSALRTFVYPEPDFKTPPVDELTLGSYISIAGQSGKFLELNDGGFVAANHVMATEFANSPDYVFTAGRMLHAPYLWGGRTPRGLDCSGLVQLVLEMAGIDAPRDTDQQEAALAQPLDSHWRDHTWKRGDLVFFKGHVGIMTGIDHIIHASSDWMEVTVEPLAALMERGLQVTGAADAAALKL